MAKRAIRLNPHVPWYFGMLGRCSFVLGLHRESLVALRRSPPDSPATLLFFAMAHAMLGETPQVAKISCATEGRVSGLHPRTVHQHLSGHQSCRHYCYKRRRPLCGFVVTSFRIDSEGIPESSLRAQIPIRWHERPMSGCGATFTLRVLVTDRVAEFRPKRHSRCVKIGPSPLSNCNGEAQRG